MSEVNESERLIKLVLFVKENPNTSFVEIRRGLPDLYGFLEKGSDEEKKMHDNKVRRCFERDKASLLGCGIHLVSGKDNLYSLDLEQSYAAPVNLSEEQASLVRIQCNALLEDQSYPFKSELRMILAKIGDDIELPDLLPNMEHSDSVKKEAPPTGFNKVYKSLSKRKRLIFDYTNQNGDDSSREVEPFGCFFFNKKCYIAAYDPEVDGERIFRLDRCTNMKVNSKSPNSPDFEERPFNAEDYCLPSFQIGSEDFTARIRFDRDNAWRAPHLMMGKGYLEKSEDGSATWVVNAKNQKELAAWCVKNGPGLTVVEPAEAIDALRCGLDAILQEVEGEKEVSK